MIVQKIYISLNIQILIVISLFMMATGYNTGELENQKISISNLEILILALYSIVLHFILYFLYKLAVVQRLNLSKYYYFKINVIYFAHFYLLLLIISFAFMLITGVGVVLSNATSPYSPIFSLISVSTWFPFFYFYNRESILNRKYFWLIVIIFVLYKLLQGWSGIILLIFFFELYFYFKNKNIAIIKQHTITLLLPLLIILTGGYIYKYVYPIKNEIRGLGFVEISYAEAVVKLTNRLTYFPIAVGAYEKSNEIKQLYYEDNEFAKETQGLFRPITPRFIMSDKEFRSLNNNVLQPFYPDITPYTSSDMGILMYLFSLFNANILDGVFWILLTLSLFIFLKIIYSMMEQWKGQFNFLLFLVIFHIFYTASLEMVFGYNFISLLFILPILYILNILNINRRKS